MSKYSVGQKFIIEIGAERLGDPILYRIKGFNTLVFDDNGLDRLEQYNGITLKDAYDEGYEKGLRDAWECAKVITNFNVGELYARFGVCFTAEVLDKFSASEAENRIVEYDAKQAEIKVGDEVESYGHRKGIVTHVSGDEIYVMWSDGSAGRVIESIIIRQDGTTT